MFEVQVSLPSATSLLPPSPPAFASTTPTLLCSSPSDDMARASAGRNADRGGEEAAARGREGGLDIRKAKLIRTHQVDGSTSRTAV